MCGDQNISFRKPIKAMLENVADIDGQVGFLESTGPLLLLLGHFPVRAPWGSPF